MAINVKPSGKADASPSVPAKAANTLPAEAAFEAMAGAGMENVSSRDLLVPRVSILQGLSPQVNKKRSEYIEGASAGDIADLGTGELMGDSMVFLPVYFKKVWIEWAPRESGKGLVAIHDTDACLAGTTPNERNQPTNVAGNTLTETHQFFGLNLSLDRRRSFISFSSTQIKKARKLNTLASSIRVKRADGSEYVPPLFYSTYVLGTAEESNSSGQWAGWTVERGAKLEELDDFQIVFGEAKAFYELLLSGEASADMSQEEGVAEKAM